MSGAILLFALLAAPAAACPFCDGGPTGVNEVAAAIFDARFLPTLASVLAPCAIVAALATALHQGWIPLPEERSR